MNPRLLHVNPMTGVQQVFHFDEAGDAFTIETRQDAAPVIEATRIERVETDRHTRYGDGLQKVASIPLTVFADLAKRGVVSPGGAVLDPAAFRRFLNDPDNRVFRTREGRV